MIVNDDMRHGATRCQSLVVTPAGAGDSHAQHLITLLINIVSTHRYRLTAGTACSDRDSDDHPITQRDQQRSLGDRIARSCGVDDAAALNHVLPLSGRTQRHCGDIDRIVNASLCRSLAYRQLLEVATTCRSDSGTHSAAVVVDVVRRGLKVNATDALTVCDRHNLAVGKRQAHFPLSRMAQCHGVSDDAPLGDTRRRRQRCGCRVDGIGNLCRHCGTGCDSIEVATTGTRNRDRESRGIQIDIIPRCSNHNRGGRLPKRNHYGGTVR